MGRVESFLNLYRSKSTKYSYSSSLKCFFGFLYGEGEDLESQAERYFAEERSFEKDLTEYLNFLKGRPPKTISLYLTAIKMFMMENEVELSQAAWRRVGRRRPKGKRARTLDVVPNNKELKRIISHMPIQGKGLYLLLASSGMRIGEALQLQLDDLDLENSHITIRGEYTKTGEPRHAFFSQETREYLEEWLRNRENYLGQATGRSALHKRRVAEDNRVFPYEINTAYFMWNTALKKSGNSERDKSTNRRKIHPHVLRKFFRTRMGAVIPVDVVEALMGHEGYLTEVYRRYTVEDLGKFFKQGEHALTVFGGVAEAEKIEELRKDRDKLQTIVNGLVSENMALKNQIQQIDGEVKAIKEEMEKERVMVGELSLSREECLKMRALLERIKGD